MEEQQDSADGTAQPDPDWDGPSAFRVVVTGGPGGGKTTAADLFRREIGDRVIIVPEAATLLFTGGFPRPEEPAASRSVQRAIYHVQRNLEDVQAARYPERLQVCDRGTVDGGAYWPGGADEFFASVGTSHEAELARYDAVIFFETAAAGGFGFASENRFRTESQEKAIDLDAQLRELWQAHPRYMFIPHATSFFRKMTMALGMLESIVAQHNSTPH